MMCRGGLVVGESAGAFRARGAESPAQATTRSTSAPMVLIAITVLAAAIAWTVPANIPPLVESDYAYLLTAADRWYAGLGPTTTPPVAPLQPWEWQADWTFLTKWPIGYPAILVSLRTLLGITTLQSCHLVAWVATAAALVGWFLWLRRLAPRRLSGAVLAAVGAGSALTTSFFVNPSTDLILIAVLPYVLLLVSRHGELRAWSGIDTMSLGSLILAGLICGGLFSIRYASLFVPAGIAAYLALEWIRRRSTLRSLVAFAIASFVPIAALIALNRTLADGDSLQSQFNLGHAARADVSLATILTAWTTFTDLGYYPHRPVIRWFLTALPFGTVLWMLVRGRRPGNVAPPLMGGAGATDSLSGSAIAWHVLRISGLILAAGLMMLIVGSTFFGTKFNFVTLERYYLPLRPLYFAIFLAPLLWIDRTWIRGVLCVALVLAGSWTVRQEWGRDMTRWSAAAHPATASGARSHCFEPGSTELFVWLNSRNDPSLVVLSNFHEFIAFETGIPAIPIPPDSVTLDLWLKRIAQARGVANPQPIFVLNPTNGTRDYWIPASATIIEMFDLQSVLVEKPIGGYVFIPRHYRSPIS